MKVEISEFALGVSFGLVLGLFIDHISSKNFHQLNFPEYLMEYDFLGNIVILGSIMIVFLSLNIRRVKSQKTQV
jgi:hypothetical protein